MKKFLLVTILCFAPLFSSQVMAQEMTPEEQALSDEAEATLEDFPMEEEEEIDENYGESPFCNELKTYITTKDNTAKAKLFKSLPEDVQNAVQLEMFLTQNLQIPQATIQKTLNLSNKQLLPFNITFIEHKIYNSCIELQFSDDIPLYRERIETKINFILKKALIDYEKLETRARMPFVHHGNVLPGPEEDEDGSIYLEQKFLPKFINAILIFLMSLSILMIIVGGLMFIFSSGDQEMTTRGKTTIMWAIVGVVLTILSYAIVQFIIGIDFTL